MAARKRGIEIRPARYASSPAPTSGSSTGASGVNAAAAVPPSNSKRFERNRNASFTYSDVVAPCGETSEILSGLVIAGASRTRQVVDDVANLEHVLHELGFPLHFLRRPVGRRHVHFPEYRARSRRKDVHAIAEIHRFFDRVRDEKDRRLRFAPEIDEQRLHVQSRG